MTEIGAETGIIGIATMIATETTGTRIVIADTANMTLARDHVPAPPAETLNTNMTGITTTTGAETPAAPPIKGAPTIILTLADIDHDISFHNDLLKRTSCHGPDFLWPINYSVSQTSWPLLLNCYLLSSLCSTTAV